MENENNIDKQALLDMISKVSKDLGANAKGIDSAIESGNLEKLLSSLPPKHASKLQQALSNKEMAKRILSSPQAAQLIKELNK